MAEPVRRAPLAGQAQSDRSIPGREPVTLAALPFVGKLILRGSPSVLQTAAGALGARLPDAMGSTIAGNLAVLWLGPDEWLVLAPADRIAATAASLRTALTGTHHAVVEVSDRMTGIAVAGARARDVLNAGCPLDLHPFVFPPGAVTRTLLAKAPVILRRPGEAQAFELWVNGSFAPYAWQFVENAAREFGVSIAA
jgi:sarcosine oxidase subunit gamma